MQLWELFVLAVGLSMDAFAVAVCKGLAVQKAGWKHAATAGLWFGGFQAGMPLLGWALGVRFQAVIVNVDHWVAFVLLGIIGGNMVREGLCKKDECDNLGSSFSPKAMLPMALALGDSGETTQGLALVNIGGLTASTILALLMLPAYYSVMNRGGKQSLMAD